MLLLQRLLLFILCGVLLLIVAGAFGDVTWVEMAGIAIISAAAAWWITSRHASHTTRIRPPTP
jgi:Ca2+/Na+ antiporter